MALVSEVVEQPYGTLPDGRDVTIFRVTAPSGMTVAVTDYGAILVSVEVPDREARFDDVTLGYDDLAGWLTNKRYFGATVGRFGNRIAHGRFDLDGRTHQLATNNAPGGIPCHLHGGIRGFDKVLWRGESFSSDGASGVRFTYTSPDGDEGYPGTMDVEVTYTLTDDELRWDARATTDAPTVVNLVHHSYWNLSGDPRRTVDDHELTLYADRYLTTDAGLIPIGDRRAVEGTPMDFIVSTPIGRRVESDFPALRTAGGYDHCWILRGDPDGELTRAAVVHHPGSGRTIEVSTNQPAIQFYSGNSLDGSIVGKSGVRYGARSGLCLETETFPDAPNQPGFPNAVLRPGEVYHHAMVHRFSIR